MVGASMAESWLHVLFFSNSHLDCSKTIFLPHHHRELGAPSAILLPMTRTKRLSDSLLNNASILCSFGTHGQWSIRNYMWTRVKILNQRLSNQSRAAFKFQLSWSTDIPFPAIVQQRFAFLLPCVSVSPTVLYLSLSLSLSLSFFLSFFLSLSFSLSHPGSIPSALPIDTHSRYVYPVFFTEESPRPP